MRAFAVGIAAFSLVILRAGVAFAISPFPVVETTIEEIQTAIIEGRTRCVDVIGSHMTRIHRFDSSTRLNAITEVNLKASYRAAAIDKRIKAGEKLGPLFCVPILLKDNFDTADMITAGGSALLEKSRPPDDAFMVRKLREADAIIIAKTNMAEWAFNPRETVSSTHGVTRNSYDRAYVPAGSSGGTASGIAASFGIGGMGSDTGNSIRGPASHLSLFGIRSTIGLTSRDGVIPMSLDRDIAGPLTRSVTDGAKLFNVLAGYDPADPITELGKGRREADYTTFLKADGLEGARLGVLGALTYTEDADPEITALFKAALADLEKAGATIVRSFKIPELDSHRNGGYFCPRWRYDMYVYLKSLGDKAPLLDVAELRETMQFTKSPRASSAFMQSRIEGFAEKPLDVHPKDWQPACPGFSDHPGRQAFLADTLAAMDAAGVDAILYPTWNNPPAPVDDAYGGYKGDNSQEIAPATGLPAVTVPMGFSHGNLPAGLQILARPYAEGLLFQYAYAYEQATMHRRPPADYPE